MEDRVSLFGVSKIEQQKALALCVRVHLNADELLKVLRGIRLAGGINKVESSLKAHKFYGKPLAV